MDSRFLNTVQTSSVGSHIPSLDPTHTARGRSSYILDALGLLDIVPSEWRYTILFQLLLHSQLVS